MRKNETPRPDAQKIGKFDILRVLGTGAQSVVYLAHDAHLQREVAIKSPHLEGRDETRKQALMDAARTVSNCAISTLCRSSTPARRRPAQDGKKDIFDVALTRGADILISDIRDPKISGHIPEWFGKTVAAETFILFPLVIKNAPVGLIYADKQRAGELVIPENVLSMLRALRNQAVLAIKQSR